MYELYCANLLTNAGWHVRRIPPPDFGVDLIATLAGVRLAIQCKNQRKNVGVSAVQQVVAGQEMYKHITHRMVASGSGFSKSAHKLATATRTHLAHHDSLVSSANSLITNSVIKSADHTRVRIPHSLALLPKWMRIWRTVYATYRENNSLLPSQNDTRAYAALDQTNLRIVCLNSDEPQVPSRLVMVEDGDDPSDAVGLCVPAIAEDLELIEKVRATLEHHQLQHTIHFAYMARTVAGIFSAAKRDTSLASDLPQPPRAIRSSAPNVSCSNV